MRCLVPRLSPHASRCSSDSPSRHWHVIPTLYIVQRSGRSFLRFFLCTPVIIFANSPDFTSVSVTQYRPGRPQTSSGYHTRSYEHFDSRIDRYHSVSVEYARGQFAVVLRIDFAMKGAASRVAPNAEYSPDWRISSQSPRTRYAMLCFITIPSAQSAASD